jgi:hypothetical protein
VKSDPAGSSPAYDPILRRIKMSTTVIVGLVTVGIILYIAAVWTIDNFQLFTSAKSYLELYG